MSAGLSAYLNPINEAIFVPKSERLLKASAVMEILFTAIPIVNLVMKSSILQKAPVNALKYPTDFLEGVFFLKTRLIIYSFMSPPIEL